MTERDAFLAAVAANPDDDLTRLVFADWLDERGDRPAAFCQRETVARRRVLVQPAEDRPRLEYAALCDQYADGVAGRKERAEFIRVQVELAKLESRKLRCTFNPVVSGGTVCHCQKCSPERPLRTRERKLWDHWATTWYGERWAILHRGPPDEDSTANYPDLGHAFIARGFPSEYHGPLDRWCGVACGQCHGSGRYEEYAGATHFGTHTPFACAACHGTGRTSDIGPAVVAAHPVERVVLTDREPYRGSRDSWNWYDESRSIPIADAPLANIPTALFSVLTSRSRWVGYRTEDLARSALSAALILWAKGAK